MDPPDPAPVPAAPALHGVLPWTRSCFVCGAENPHGLRLRSQVAAGRVFLEYTPRPEDVGYRHIVHGGIGMTLVDEVMTWAAILATGRLCVAAEMTTRLKQPMRVGQPVRVEGWVAQAGSRLCRTVGHILDAAGTVLLDAQGKYMPMPASAISLCDKDFIFSPETIRPDAVVPVAPGGLGPAHRAGA